MVYKKLNEFPPKKTCNFCHTRRSDEIELGEIANIKNIYCHYFCLLLSHNVLQNGKDSQGILGFLPNDITKAIKDGTNLLCSYCNKSGATIKCSGNNCRLKFHLPCGLKKGSIHQFFDAFSSYCVNHRQTQKIPAEITVSSTTCILCANALTRAWNSNIWVECCKPSALIHRRCLQRMAMTHGYAFKCPLCNDKKVFIKSVKRLGIYIPERDPEWEREERAFHELLDRTISCEMGSNCLCSNGQSYSRLNSKWKLERCNLCGGVGIHLACSPDWTPGSSFCMSWTCGTCSAAEPTVGDSRASNTISDPDTEMEIDVETIDNFQPDETRHLTSQSTPSDPVVVLERRGSLDCLHPELPIFISDSEDELEVVSVSSTEDSALTDFSSTLPLERTRSLNTSLTTIPVPRPIVVPRTVVRQKRFILAPVPQIFYVRKRKSEKKDRVNNNILNK